MNIPKFCPSNCKYLSPTEEEQNNQMIKAEHKCGKYGIKLFHGSFHPNLIKLVCCSEFD